MCGYKMKFGLLSIMMRFDDYFRKEHHCDEMVFTPLNSDDLRIGCKLAQSWISFEN